MSQENESKGDAKLPVWFSVAKDFIWIIGIIVVVLYKFQEQENINKTQDVQLSMMIAEHKQLYGKLESLNDALTQLVLEVTTLRIQRESDARNSGNGTGRIR